MTLCITSSQQTQKYAGFTAKCLWQKEKEVQQKDDDDDKLADAQGLPFEHYNLVMENHNDRYSDVDYSLTSYNGPFKKRTTSL